MTTRLKSDKDPTTTTDIPHSSNIKTVAAPILKNPVSFGNEVMAIAIHGSLVKHFGITEDTQIQEEVVEGVGILLRIVRKDISNSDNRLNK